MYKIKTYLGEEISNKPKKKKENYNLSLQFSPNYMKNLGPWELAS
jgi:hypothetical protein